MEYSLNWLAANKCLGADKRDIQNKDDRGNMMKPVTKRIWPCKAAYIYI